MAQRSRDHRAYAGLNPAQGPPAATYQTRVSGYVGLDREAGDAALAAYAELYGQVERKLFADVAAGRSAVPLKSDYIREHGIPARMFSGVRVSLEGKVSAVRAAQRLRVDSLERRIAQAERQVAQAEEQGRWQQVHQKRRRLANLRSRLAGLETDLGAGRVRLCFGSKRLWRKQHHLEQNGYASHEEWLQDWQDARSNEFFVLGSRDETSGCQLCVASIADDGSLTLRLRMPDCLANQHGKYLVIPHVRFAYGHEQVLAALGSNAEYVAYRREHGEKAARATALGQAISYRFKRDSKGLAGIRHHGVAGGGGNDRPAAWSHRGGPECGSSRGGGDRCEWQLRERVAGAAGDLRQEPPSGGGHDRRRGGERGGVRPRSRQAHRHREAGLPAEEGRLEGESRRYSRMLSSFSYGKVKAYFLSRGYREGVEIIEVNPAYSSVVGRVKFMERYGLTVHQAAALVLARRLLGCSERIPRRWVAPIGNGVQVAFTVPARKRVKHVWTYWGAVSRQLRPALAAQHRLGKRRRRPNPVQAVARAEARGVA